MKFKLVVRKRGSILYEDVHVITDAESFGTAFTSVWARLQDRRLQRTTSIGELMEVLNEDVLDELDGAQIHLEKA